MKRFLAIILALAVVFTMTAGFAEAPALDEIKDVSIVYDAGTQTISVSGFVTSQKANALMIFRMTNSSDVDVLVDTTTTRKTDKGITFDFGAIGLVDDFVSDDYTVEISGTNLAKYTQPFAYGDWNDKATYLGEIKTADETEGVTMGSVIGVSTKAQVLGLNTVDYESIKNETDATRAFEYIMKNGTYTAPDASDHEGIVDALKYLKGIYDKAIAAGKFMAIDEGTNAWRDWYDRYYNQLGFDTEDVEEEEKVTPRVVDVLDSNELLSRIALFDGKATIDEIKRYIYEQALLTNIEIGTDTTVEDILTYYSDEYFTGSGFEIDWDGADEIGDTNWSLVISEISGQHFDTCKAMVDEINDEIDSKKEKKTSDNTPDRNGGSIGVRPTYIPKEETVEKVIFSDIAGVDWAVDAINYLYEKGVVNGNGDGTFAPDNNVTRAEFIKMVISAMGVGAPSYANPFNDVDSSSWYITYVTKAFELGLVLGDENSNFYPEAPITRQDMVTILYRALGTEGKANVSFTDAEQISDYAKAAVGYFAEQGIVNGLGGGSFGPLNNATRAQTAVIIYRIMKLKGLI